MNKGEIILVDEKDNQIGVGEKLKIHQQGKLHRAFSIFVFNPKGELLLQKRAESKYHSAGLWTNTCCSHPRPHQDIKNEAKKRLREEMGFECDLKEIFNFIYKADLDHLTEYEFDHVLVGEFSGEPIVNRDEVSQWQWLKPTELKEDVKKYPENYTHWFKKIVGRVLRQQSLNEK